MWTFDINQNKLRIKTIVLILKHHILVIKAFDSKIDEPKECQENIFSFVNCPQEGNWNSKIAIFS